MDDRFFTALFPGEATVCGRRLTVFSTHHYATLAAVDSPLVREGAEIRPQDLLAAVRVCRTIHGKPMDLRPSLRDLWWKRRMERDKELFEREFRTFDAFMEAHASVPKFWTVEEGGQRMRALTGPRVLITVTTAMMRLHMPEDDAWNMSIGRLHWYCAEAAELDGSERRFLDENEMQSSREAMAAMGDDLPPEEIAIPMMTAHYGDEAQARREYAAMKKRKEQGNA